MNLKNDTDSDLIDIGKKDELKKYPLIPTRNSVVYPATSITLLLGRKHSVAAMKEAQRLDNLIVVSVELPKELKIGDDKKQIYTKGTLCRMGNITGSDGAGYQVEVSGLIRFDIQDVKENKTWLEVEGTVFPEENDESPETIALFNIFKNLNLETLELWPEADEKMKQYIKGIESQPELVYSCASQLRLSLREAQEILELDEMKLKIEKLMGKVKKQRDILLLESDIMNKMSKKMDKAKKQAILREQLEAIREELGEREDMSEKPLHDKSELIDLPDAVRKVVDEEKAKLDTMNPSSPDYNVSHSYLTYLLEMPWCKSTEDQIDINRASAILDAQHYGMEKVKKRILGYLAVLKLNKNKKSPILCLLGPPGVGKTSLGKSIADAIGRKFVRVSLGGVRDESEIRGHRRTYVGAMPGRLIQGIKRSGYNNPVMLLDEIDKLGASFQGNPSAAMLEVLDPEQNSTFVDRYLDVSFDLSRTFFICTANQLDTIPAPLRDRMEIIEHGGYTKDEKIHIAKQFILPSVLDENGLNETKVEVDERVLPYIVEHYTKEAGVRGLKREIESVARGAAYELVKEDSSFIVLDKKKVNEYLGPERFEGPQVLPHLVPGIVAGLAYTPVGGEVLYIESIKIPGDGKLKSTGQLGDVMKESASIAQAYMLSLLPRIDNYYEANKFDIHLHVPAGAVPKDGPSAGIAMLTALTSLALGRKVPVDLAMTGELTLTGSVLPVGGIKEKVIAAHRAGMKMVILPKKNAKDLIEVPEEIKKELEFYLVENADRVIEMALGVHVIDGILDRDRREVNEFKEKRIDM